MSKPTRSVCQLTLKGELVKIWPSIKSTVQSGFDRGSISRCCHHQQDTCKGYRWEFLFGGDN